MRRLLVSTIMLLCYVSPNLIIVMVDSVSARKFSKIFLVKHLEVRKFTPKTFTFSSLNPRIKARFY